MAPCGSTLMNRQLFNEMTELGDPFAIEVLYELENNSDLERLLSNAGY